MSMYKLYIFKSYGRNIYYAIYNCLECTGMACDLSLSNIIRNIKNNNLYYADAVVCTIANNNALPCTEVISCKTYYSIEEIYDDNIQELL